jgi:pseudouridylate synthase
MPSSPSFSVEVRDALAAGRPVVALESTILAHGLPWPDNFAIGQALEAEVRAHGATPATIAVLDGQAHVGLEATQLERVAREGARFAKAGAVDLGVAMVRGGSAATTVSATAVLAARAGIAVFATGGIGGVHRGDSGDVSSDLTTLGRERIAVVSAGAKAILDLPRTVEMLETLGVLVLGYGTDEFPAFYTRRSGIALEHRVDTAGEAARILAAHWALGRGGVLIANPCPIESALEPEFIDAAIAQALADAAAQRIVGKPLTPFLLAHLARATQGRSITTNRALALSNARVGSQLAVAFSSLG